MGKKVFIITYAYSGLITSRHLLAELPSSLTKLIRHITRTYTRMQTHKHLYNVNAWTGVWSLLLVGVDPHNKAMTPFAGGREFYTGASRTKDYKGTAALSFDA